MVGVHYVFGQLQPIIFLSISQSTGQQQQQQRYQPDRVSFGDAPTHRKLLTAAESIRYAVRLGNYNRTAAEIYYPVSNSYSF
jgi:hypothetical protein